LTNEEEIKNLKGKISEYKKEINLLSSSSDNPSKFIAYQKFQEELSNKITKLASSLLNLSNLQNRIVQSVARNDKYYEQELKILIKEITKLKNNIDMPLFKERELIEDALKKFKKNQDFHSKKLKKEKEILFNDVTILQTEIEIVCGEVNMLKTI